MNVKVSDYKRAHDSKEIRNKANIYNGVVKKYGVVFACGEHTVV